MQNRISNLIRVKQEEAPGVSLVVTNRYDGITQVLVKNGENGKHFYIGKDKLDHEPK